MTPHQSAPTAQNNTTFSNVNCTPPPPLSNPANPLLPQPFLPHTFSLIPSKARFLQTTMQHTTQHSEAQIGRSPSARPRSVTFALRAVPGPSSNTRMFSALKSLCTNLKSCKNARPVQASATRLQGPTTAGDGDEEGGRGWT